MTAQTQQPIKVEPLEYENDTDLYALITVTAEDGDVIEVHYNFDELQALNREIGGVLASICWHRAQWLQTLYHGTTHLARKSDRKVLCGRQKDTFGHEWDFGPFFKGYSSHGVCKRCWQLFEKATAEQ